MNCQEASIILSKLYEYLVLYSVLPDKPKTAYVSIYLAIGF